MTITIYTIRTGDDYELGRSAIHLLAEPAEISRTWIDRAEYALPEGYTVAEDNNGSLGVYNIENRHCPLADSKWNDKGGGQPVLVDSSASPWRVKLKKVRDLPW